MALKLTPKVFNNSKSTTYRRRSLRRGPRPVTGEGPPTLRPLLASRMSDDSGPDHDEADLDPQSAELRRCIESMGRCVNTYSLLFWKHPVHVLLFQDICPSPEVTPYALCLMNCANYTTESYNVPSACVSSRIPSHCLVTISTVVGVWYEMFTMYLHLPRPPSNSLQAPHTPKFSY